MPLVVAGLCGMSVAYGVLAGSSVAQDTPPSVAQKPLKVAVVNLYEAFKGSKIYQELQDKMQSYLKEDFDDKIKGLQNDFQKVDDEIKERETDIGTPGFTIDKWRHDRAVLSEQLDATKDARKQAAGVLQSQFMAEVIAATFIIIEEVAKGQDYDIVLRRPVLSVESDPTTNSLEALLNAKAFAQNSASETVLYFNERKDTEGSIVDITKEVKQRMQSREYNDDMKSKVKARLAPK